jgi:hypothetical protein
MPIFFENFHPARNAILPRGLDYATGLNAIRTEKSIAKSGVIHRGLPFFQRHFFLRNFERIVAMLRIRKRKPRIFFLSFPKKIQTYKRLQICLQLPLPILKKEFSPNWSARKP